MPNVTRQFARRTVSRSTDGVAHSPRCHAIPSRHHVARRQDALHPIGGEYAYARHQRDGRPIAFIDPLVH